MENVPPPTESTRRLSAHNFKPHCSSMAVQWNGDGSYSTETQYKYDPDQHGQFCASARDYGILQHLLGVQRVTLDVICTLQPDGEDDWASLFGELKAAGECHA